MPLQPTLAEILRTALDSRLSDVHTSIPGRVKTYDSATQTADIEIVITRAETSSSGGIIHEEYPVLPNVPVAWPRGAGYSFQFPLDAGDHVWLLFSEASTGQWRASGDLSNPGDLERHGLSYPIALPCIAPDSDPLPVASGALVTTPSGGALSVSEAGGAPEPVAIASRVEAAFSDLATALSTATAGGDALVMTWTPPTDLSASNLNAEPE